MKKTTAKKIVVILLLAVFAATATGAWFYFRDRDKRLLRALVTELEDMSAKRQGRSNALALLDAATPERVFAKEVEIISDHPAMKRTMKVKELGQLMLAMKKSCTSTQLDISIDTITVNGESATVSGNALFSGSSSRGGSFREARNLELECAKNAGKWKIVRIKAHSIIRK